MPCPCLALPHPAPPVAFCARYRIVGTTVSPVKSGVWNNDNIVDDGDGLREMVVNAQPPPAVETTRRMWYLQAMSPLEEFISLSGWARQGSSTANTHPTSLGSLGSLALHHRPQSRSRSFDPTSSTIQYSKFLTRLIQSLQWWQLYETPKHEPSSLVSAHFSTPSIHPSSPANIPYIHTCIRYIPLTSLEQQKQQQKHKPRLSFLCSWASTFGHCET